MRYGVLKISFGRGLRSIRAILVNIELDLTFMITKLSAKFHRNRLRTFRDMAFLKVLLDKVCALSGRFLSTSNLTFLL